MRPMKTVRHDDKVWCTVEDGAHAGAAGLWDMDEEGFRGYQRHWLFQMLDDQIDRALYGGDVYGFCIRNFDAEFLFRRHD